ncbi:hypothetical protein [Bradyrhizobium sp. dw_78]|uniref:hypothetical protein n=1 Tax=Bradyrhizobium sp. dw_78 TaxID=2719793 RepID=UPI001BD1FBE4|nr:hypothetical protein [Bradyrhizobium sp. dw_78]
MKIKILEMWMSGSAELSKAEVPRGQIIEIEEMMNLPFEAFVAMFGEKQEEESAENAAEVN